MTKVITRQTPPAHVELGEVLNAMKNTDGTMKGTEIHLMQAGQYDETTFFTVTVGGEPAKRCVRLSNILHFDDTLPAGAPQCIAQAVVFETYAVAPETYSTSKTRRYWHPEYFEPRYTPPALVNGFPDPSTIKLIKRSFVGDLQYVDMTRNILAFLKDGTLPA